MLSPGWKFPKRRPGLGFVRGRRTSPRFLGFARLANFTAVLGAISVASAMLLILPFSQPYSGTFSLRASGIDGVLAAPIPDAAQA